MPYAIAELPETVRLSIPVWVAEPEAPYGQEWFRAERVRFGDLTVLRVRGRVEALLARAFIEELRWSLLESRAGVVVNLAGCTFLSSLGWGAILATVSAAGKLGRRFSLCEISPPIATSMALLGTRALPPVFPTEAAALAAATGSDRG